jgi:hypothetical protein
MPKPVVSSGFLAKILPLVCANEGLLTRCGALFSVYAHRLHYLHRANEDRGTTDATKVLRATGRRAAFPALHSKTFVASVVPRNAARVPSRIFGFLHCKYSFARLNRRPNKKMKIDESTDGRLHDIFTFCMIFSLSLCLRPLAETGYEYYYIRRDSCQVTDFY